MADPQRPEAHLLPGPDQYQHHRYSAAIAGLGSAGRCCRCIRCTHAGQRAQLACLAPLRRVCRPQRRRPGQRPQRERITVTTDVLRLTFDTEGGSLIRSANSSSTR
jgi:hypothetical protein